MSREEEEYQVLLVHQGERQLSAVTGGDFHSPWVAKASPDVTCSPHSVFQLPAPPIKDGFLEPFCGAQGELT